MEDLDLRTRIGKVWVEGVIGNSPGPRKSIDECHEIGRSPASVITLGSITRKPRVGNSGTTYWTDEKRPVATALNSIGLRNEGTEEILERVEELKVHGKPVIVSLAAEMESEFLEMAEMFANRGLSIELNLTCPNVDRQGRILAYDLDLASRTIYRVRRAIGDDNLIVKLNPHFDTLYQEEMSRMLPDTGVDVVALCNTVPYGIVIDPDSLQPVISAMTFGGVSGRSVHPIVLGQVVRYRRLLPAHIDIICEGGIWSGFDILAYFVGGGAFCRTATMYAEVGVKAFEQLTTQFIEEMEKRGLEALGSIPRLRDLPPFPADTPVSI